MTPYSGTEFKMSKYGVQIVWVSKMKKLTTSKLAKLANVNVETIRYYERQKLLPIPPKIAIGVQYPLNKSLFS